MLLRSKPTKAIFLVVASNFLTQAPSTRAVTIFHATVDNEFYSEIVIYSLTGTVDPVRGNRPTAEYFPKKSKGWWWQKKKLSSAMNLLENTTSKEWREDMVWT